MKSSNKLTTKQQIEKQNIEDLEKELYSSTVRVLLFFCTPLVTLILIVLVYVLKSIL